MTTERTIDLRTDQDEDYYIRRRDSAVLLVPQSRIGDMDAKLQGRDNSWFPTPEYQSECAAWSRRVALSHARRARKPSDLILWRHIQRGNVGWSCLDRNKPFEFDGFEVVSRVPFPYQGGHWTIKGSHGDYTLLWHSAQSTQDHDGGWYGAKTLTEARAMRQTLNAEVQALLGKPA